MIQDNQRDFDKIHEMLKKIDVTCNKMFLDLHHR